MNSIGENTSGFWEKIVVGRIAIAHRGPRDVAGGSMVGARRGSQPPEAWPEIGLGTARATGGVAS
jgi:hypothetical protein